MTKSVLSHSICLPSFLSVTNVMNRYARCTDRTFIFDSVLARCPCYSTERGTMPSKMRAYSSIRFHPIVWICNTGRCRCLASKRRGHRPVYTQTQMPHDLFHSSMHPVKLFFGLLRVCDYANLLFGATPLAEKTNCSRTNFDYLWHFFRIFSIVL